MKGGRGVGDRVWYGGDDRIGLGLQMAISSCKPWLLAIAIGLQMAIEGTRAHNSCYHQIALVGEGWTCLVIQVLLLSEVAGGGGAISMYVVFLLFKRISTTIKCPSRCEAMKTSMFFLIV